MSDTLPRWAEEMRALYTADSACQFILHGNVSDLVAVPGAGGAPRFASLGAFLTEVMLEPFKVVICYDRGHGIRVRRGGEHFYGFLKAFDAFQGTSWAKLPDLGPDKLGSLELGNLLPRDAGRALEIVNRFLRWSVQRSRAGEGGSLQPDPLSVAVVVDYAQFVAPRGEPINVSGELAQNLVVLLDWASNPAVVAAPVATVLITESLTDLHPVLVDSPYSAELEVELPTPAEITAYVRALAADTPRLLDRVEASPEQLGEKLAGLTLVNVRGLLLRALRGGEPITGRYLTRVKKELIEKEASGRVEFVESRRTLDDVAGHVEAKAWLRQDAELMRRGTLRAIPMGYLLCGRIGTGKTYLVECWAGEVGVPVVQLKNFRDKWVGATEANLERVFAILHALGQVVVFVDEADQMTGKRDSGAGDSGLSGRIYGMLAKEMSDTSNRGKIIWVFATSRPDLLEVDLKRQGRLDVHIPLFPPQDEASRRALFKAMARKAGVELEDGEVPALPEDLDVGGNEMEGILIRSVRAHETQPEGGARRSLPEILAEVISSFRPSAHVERLELMDLLAVKECTDVRFLPERYRALDLEQLNGRIAELRRRVGE